MISFGKVSNMDFIVLITVILGLVVLIFKRPESFVIYLAAIDIFFRILNFFADNIKISEFQNFIYKNFPSDVFSIVYNYTSGIFTTVLIWVVVIIYIWFLVYIINLLIRKK